MNINEERLRQEVITLRHAYYDKFRDYPGPSSWGSREYMIAELKKAIDTNTPIYEPEDEDILT